MQIDPKYGAWGFAVVSVIAAGGSQIIPSYVPAGTAKDIVETCILIVAVVGGMSSASHFLSAPTPGPLASPAPPSVPPALKSLVGFLLLPALVVMALGGSAKAATKPLVNPLQLVQTQVTAAVNAIAAWAGDDIDGAIALSTAIPALQDEVGAQCWGQFKTIADLQKTHPLALTAKAATDLENMRLLAGAINLICRNSNCSQMWNDLQNQVGAVSPVPLPFSMTSVCAKIAPIGLTLTSTLDLAPKAAAPVKTVTPAAAATPAAKP